ncbi:thiamine phosphate synthase [Pseudoclavibacter sp. 13-3]|nr:thiamine phosphate synthase [Pseudoclavibacter sp. 13-3]MCD7100660.1 thiamine phosphate synthase [Pseudoclavibacter sp. 13-3]
MLHQAQLYLCTDARLGTGDFDEFVDAAYRGGVDVIQLRDKHLDAGDELEYFELLAAAARRHGRLFAANDRADVATLAGADILHVGQRDLSIADARSLLPGDTLVGLSTHSRVQAEQARLGDADYYCIGPVWRTPTKPGRAPVTLDAVRQVRAQGRGDAKPWFAIGGVNAETLEQVLDAGAQRIVVVRAITQADDPEAAARELRTALPRLPEPVTA